MGEARRLFEKGLRQQQGKDKTNSDPFIALYDAQHQILGALDLASNNASIWRKAAQSTVMIASLGEDSHEQVDRALRMFAKSCEMDSSNIDDTIAWTEKKEKYGPFMKLKSQIAKKVSAWKKAGVPKLSVADFLPSIERNMQNDVCTAIPSKSPAEADTPPEKDRKKQIARAVESMTARPIFPTYITQTNVIKYFGKEFVDKLSKTAIDKYRKFSADMKKKGIHDPNDINDKFFNMQREWPEMHNMPEHKQLKAFLKQALIDYCAKTGFPLNKEDQKASHVSMWAAIYLEDGGRHGYHVHQSSFSSCVFYAQVPEGNTPIMFMDPRGSPPYNDYEQHIGERDYEPHAPFHHNLAYFVSAGDIVCFPSWLVHRVPSHWSTVERVAFPANLQANNAWDAWMRSATLP